MTFGSPIAGEAIRRTLVATEADAAHQRDVVASQATLDEAELRDLDRAEYYPDHASEPVVHPVPVAPLVPAAEPRTFLDRLFRRNPR
jgi:hypothetical protein